MKLAKTLLLSSVALILVLSLALPTLADRPPTPQEAADWTKDRIHDFLHKYNLDNERNHLVDEAALKKKVQSYEKAAKNNAHYFGSKVDHFLNTIKNQLAKQSDLSQQDVDSVVSDLQYNLRHLELQGQLTRAKVEQRVDKLQRQLAKKKTISESSWNAIKNDVQADFAEHYYRPSFFQRVFSSHKPSAAESAKSSIDQWLDTVHDNLQDLRVMTDNQLQSVMDQLRQAITHANLHKVASKRWYDRLYHRLEKKAKLTEQQMDQIKETMEQQINSYKVFATDYVGTKSDESREWMDHVYDCCHHAYDVATSTLEDWLSYAMARVHDAVKGLQHRQEYVKDKAAHDLNDAKVKAANDLKGAKDKAASNLKDAKLSAEQKEQDWKHNFDKYWQHKHLEAYRRLGYSEAQIDHLKKSFSSAFASKQSLAQKNVEQTLDGMKQYMQDARVQTSAQIQAEIDKIKHHLNEWKSQW
ncbi:hypothetical protein [Absidia glauca]|uniref:Uncharacterized protein n=1 Tax=Absidia glauca TaxID=4829 RepID=A0A170AQ27_ABSGL|nr:hypothetical protein [Absidia glauca]